MHCVVAKCSSVSKEFTAFIIRVTVVSGGCCSCMDGKNFVGFVGRFEVVQPCTAVRGGVRGSGISRTALCWALIVGDMKIIG